MRFFVLAGFWELYRASSLDYQSPVKNFGETLSIGGLEQEACKALMTQPMAALNINYESETLKNRIIEKVGGRANLIAIICNEIIRTINVQSRIIRFQDINQALESNHLRSSLGGWGTLAGDDKQANRLDRIIVYSTIGIESFTVNELMQILDQYNCPYTTQQLQESLARLSLAFIIGRKKNQYHYFIPLFKTMISSEEPETFLNREIKEANLEK